MLSGKLIHLIEIHHKDITDRVTREIRSDPELPGLRQLPEAEIHERCQTILENLGHWLASGNVETLAQKQESIGKLRFEQGIPLHETVRALCLLKDHTVRFLEEHGLPVDPVGIYAEQELVNRFGRFFDTLVIHLVKGYEDSWRHAAQLVASINT